LSPSSFFSVALLFLPAAAFEEAGSCHARDLRFISLSSNGSSVSRSDRFAGFGFISKDDKDDFVALVAFAALCSSSSSFSSLEEEDEDEDEEGRSILFRVFLSTSSPSPPPKSVHDGCETTKSLNEYDWSTS
jgi:hypothetical protein